MLAGIKCVPPRTLNPIEAIDNPRPTPTGWQGSNAIDQSFCDIYNIYIDISSSLASDESRITSGRCGVARVRGVFLKQLFIQCYSREFQVLSVVCRHI